MPRRIGRLMARHGEHEPNKLLQMLLLFRRALLLGGRTAVLGVYVLDASDQEGRPVRSFRIVVRVEALVAPVWEEGACLYGLCVDL